MYVYAENLYNEKIKFIQDNLILCFSLKCCDFSELCKFYCCSAGVWPEILYTHWHRGKTDRGQSPEYIFKTLKNTIFNEHPVYGNLTSKWPIYYKIYVYFNIFWYIST